MSVARQPLLIDLLYPPQELQAASAGRRLGAWVLDVLIFLLTAVIGWSIWFIVVAQRGQSPGKQLLGLYIMREDGTRAGGSYTWLREILVQWILIFLILGGVTSFIGWLVAAAWLLWDKDRQCLWDKIANTHIAYSPNNFRPLTRDELALAGEAPPTLPTSANIYPPPPPTGGLSVADQLRDLKHLLDEELISQEEFDERRSRLVDRL